MSIFDKIKDVVMEPETPTQTKVQSPPRLQQTVNKPEVLTSSAPEIAWPTET